MRPRKVHTIGQLLNLHTREVQEYDRNLKRCEEIVGYKLIPTRPAPYWFYNLFTAPGRLVDLMNDAEGKKLWSVSGPFGLGCSVLLDRGGHARVVLQYNNMTKTLKVQGPIMKTPRFPANSIGDVNGFNCHMLSVPRSATIKELVRALRDKRSTSKWIKTLLKIQTTAK